MLTTEDKRFVQDSMREIHAQGNSALHSDMTRHFLSFEERLKKLESWQAFMMGGLAIIVVLFVPILLLVVQHFIK